MLKLIKIELIKLWRSKVTWVYVLFFIILIGFLSFSGTALIIPERVNTMPDKNPWYILLGFRFFHILLVVLITGLLTVNHFQMEHRNDMFKQVLVIPLKPFTFFTLKMIVLLLSVFIFQLLYWVTIALGTYYSGLNYYNEIDFSKYNYIKTIPFQLLLSMRVFICLWGYLAILSIINIYIRNSVLAVAFVVLLWFANVSRLSSIIPSGFAVQSDRLMSKYFSATLTYDFSIFRFELYSLAVFFLVLIITYFLDKSRLLINI